MSAAPAPPDYESHIKAAAIEAYDAILDQTHEGCRTLVMGLPEPVLRIVHRNLYLTLVTSGLYSETWLLRDDEAFVREETCELAQIAAGYY